MVGINMGEKYSLAGTAAQRLLDGSHGFLFTGVTNSPPAEGGVPRLDLGIGLRAEALGAKGAIVEALVARFLLDLTGGREPFHSEFVDKVDNGLEILKEQDLEMMTDADTPFGEGTAAGVDALGPDEQLVHLNKKREITKQWFEQDRERLGFRVGAVVSEDTHAKIETLLGSPLGDPPWNASGSDSPPVGSAPPLRFGYGGEEFTPTVAGIDWISTTAPDREPIEIEMSLIGGWIVVAASVVDEEPSALLRRVAGHIEIEDPA